MAAGRLPAARLRHASRRAPRVWRARRPPAARARSRSSSRRARDGLRPRPATLARRVAARGGRAARRWRCTASARRRWWPRSRRSPRCRARAARDAGTGSSTSPSVRRRWSRAIAALGLVVVTNPAFVHWRGDVYRAETPARRAAWLYRARSLAAAGVPLAGASDAPVVPPSPWVGDRGGAHAAHGERRRARGRRAARRRRRAPRSSRRGAAFALGDDRLGRLVPGGARRPGRSSSPIRCARRPTRCATRASGSTLVDGERGVAGVRPFATLRYEKRGAVAVVTPRPAGGAERLQRRDARRPLRGARRGRRGPGGARARAARPRPRLLDRRRPDASSARRRRRSSRASVRWRRDVWGRLLDLRAATRRRRARLRGRRRHGDGAPLRRLRGRRPTRASRCPRPASA